MTEFKETGVGRTEARLRSFEEKYQLSTVEFLERYSNDEFQETLELDEWIGESRMFDRLQEKAERLRGVNQAVDSETQDWLDADLGGALPDYDWGEAGIPEGIPIRYVVGEGIVIKDGVSVDD